MPSETSSRLVVMSGPSGAGKSTVVRELMAKCPLPLHLSVSATTRKPRLNEIDGKDYFFLTPEHFAARRAAGEFLECKEYAGNWYGTLQSQVTAGLAEGKWVLLEIDVEGTMAVLEKHPDALTIFVHSGSIEELERRLRARKTESEDALARRLETAKRELAQKDRYRYQVINRDVPQAVREVCDILIRHAAKT
ncbi:MAG: guanylate kinase [Planctomycetia bacterium]|jgi:guanylate kinase|nr:guanylate kinase [Planctomycetia bacterium]